MLLSLPVLVVTGLFVAYLLFAWLGFEPLVKWAAHKVVADKSGHSLTIERARLNPFKLTVELQGVKLSEPEGRPLLALADLFVDFDAASVFKRAYVFEQIRLTEPVVDVALRADGSLNWGRLVDAFAGAPPAEQKDDSRMPRVLVHDLALEKGRINFSDDKYTDGFKTSVDPLNLELHELSTLPDDKGNYTVSARTAIGAQVRWKGEMGLNPPVASGELRIDDLLLVRLWPYLEDRLHMAPPEGKAALGLTYRLRYEQRQLALEVDQLSLRTDGIVLRGVKDAAPSIVLSSLAIGGGRFDLQKRSARIDSIEVHGGKLAFVRAADGRLSMQDWLAPPRASASAQRPASSSASASAPASAPASASASSSAPAEAPWHVGVGAVTVDGLALHFIDQGTAAPFVGDIDKLSVKLKADAAIGAGAPALTLDGVGIAVHGVRLVSDSVKEPFLEVGDAVLDGGRIDLAARDASVARLALTGGRLRVARERDGSIPLLEALQPSAVMLARPELKVAEAIVAKKPGSAWRYRVEQVQTAGFEVALRDDSVDPPLQATLQNIEASAKGLSSDAAATVPVQLKFAVMEGGRFEAHGDVVPGAPSADIELSLTGLALKPLQPLVSQRANLVLVDGAATTAGRLRYGDGKFRYQGSASVDRLLVNEVPSTERFLSWKRLSTRRLVATNDRLDSDEVLLDGLGAKLIIFKDRTVNLAKVLKAGEAASAPAGEAVKTRKAARGNAQGFRVDVGHVRLSDGDLDFADLSLALPFAARIQNLKGNVVGLSSVPGRSTRIEAEGQVNEYGLARAAGSIDLFDPGASTDIKVVFRNVEMTELTPYSATFAGRRIASGKLSLDLEYKVKDRQLSGDNKVVMDQLTLGERVDSPGARNLPLDLAIAILKDSDGKIELGLPVSGSLDDPKFSYGSLIWKAVVNVISKIVTA
ncbi:MAG: DUF748 domain-containing protein, partial [Caldimonas sp.]